MKRKTELVLVSSDITVCQARAQASLEKLWRNFYDSLFRLASNVKIASFTPSYERGIS